MTSRRTPAPRELLIDMWIRLDNVQGFLGETLDWSRVEEGGDRYWAAPFNTDVGMLFERIPGDRAEESRLGLAEVVDDANVRRAVGPDLLRLPRGVRRQRPRARARQGRLHTGWRRLLHQGTELPSALVAYLLPLIGVREREPRPEPAQQESWPVAVVRTVVLVVVSIVLLVLVWISVQLMDTSALSRIAAKRR